MAVGTDLLAPAAPRPSGPTPRRWRRRVRAAVDAARLLAGGAPGAAVLRATGRRSLGSARCARWSPEGWASSAATSSSTCARAATRSSSLDRHGEHAVDITDGPAVTAGHRRRPRPTPCTTWPAGPTSAARGRDPVGGLPRQRRGHPATCCCACAAAGVDRVLSVGSADVYGVVTEAELPLTEDSPLRPASPYAASKVAADFLGLQAFLGHGLGVIRVRAFNHLGPGQTDRFVAAALAARIAANERDGGDAVPVGNLSARRDFTDVRDVVRAYRLLVERGAPGEVYNVCSGRDLAVQELADRLLALAPPTRCALERRPGAAAARSTSRCSAATPPSSATPPAGSRRSPSTRPSPTSSTTCASGSAADQRRRTRAAQAARPPASSSVALARVVRRRRASSARRLRPAVEQRRDRRCRASSLEVAVEQPALELDLGVAGHDQRQAVGLGRRVASCRRPARAAPSRTRRPAARPCARPPCSGRSRGGDSATRDTATRSASSCWVQPELGPQLGDASARAISTRANLAWQTAVTSALGRTDG